MSALIVKDADAPEKLMDTATALVRDGGRIATLGRNAGKMALRDAAQVIADEAYKLV